jgi:7-cyano-7-deazaguanine synthase
MKKMVVLLSGGLDSTTLLAWAKALDYEVVPVSFDYGQRHAKELTAALEVALYYGITEVKKFNLGRLFTDNPSNPLTGGGPMPTGTYEELIEKTGVAETYVPYRNGIFLSIAAAHALNVGADAVAYAAHATDSRGGAYPDCTETFVAYQRSAIFAGTGQKVTLTAPFVKLTKAEVVKMGMDFEAPFHLTWSCYEGDIDPCGKCPTCLERAAAFKANGIDDPILVKEVAE